MAYGLVDVGIRSRDKYGHNILTHGMQNVHTADKIMKQNPIATTFQNHVLTNYLECQSSGALQLCTVHVSSPPL